MSTSNEGTPAPPAAPDTLSIEELARRQGIRPIRSLDDLAHPDMFSSDEEMEEFIAYTYAARRRDMV